MIARGKERRRRRRPCTRTPPLGSFTRDIPAEVLLFTVTRFFRTRRDASIANFICHSRPTAARSPESSPADRSPGQMFRGNGDASFHRDFIPHPPADLRPRVRSRVPSGRSRGNRRDADRGRRTAAYELSGDCLRCRFRFHGALTRRKFAELTDRRPVLLFCFNI